MRINFLKKSPIHLLPNFGKFSENLYFNSEEPDAYEATPIQGHDHLTQG